jgi:hypothetical protein
MDENEDDDQFLSQVLSGISEAEIITIFFPLLRRALVIDTRHDQETTQWVQVMPQVSSMEERISVIERRRPQFGKVRSILGIPWIKSVGTLREQGVTHRLVERLTDAGMPHHKAKAAVHDAVYELARVEHKAFVSLIKGEGYQTLWTAHR